MPTDIDPKIDFAFKGVFGRESNIDLLISLLNGWLEWQVQDVELLNPFTGKEELDDKLAILDLRVRDHGRRLYDIEMQILVLPAFRPRSIYYWAKNYGGQLREGQDFRELRPAISIWIVNEIVIPESERWHHVFEVRSRHEPDLRFTDHLELHIIELPKFPLAPEEVKTDAERWACFLKHGPELDLQNLPASLDTPEIRKDLMELKRMGFNDEEKEWYAQRQRAMMEYATAIGVSRDEGREEGRDEGERKQLLENIRFFEELLGRTVTPAAELREVDLADLEARIHELRTAVRNRHP